MFAMTGFEVRTVGDMKTALEKLARALNYPQYNYILHTGPVRWARRGYWTTLDYDYHWHIEVMPRLTHVAGFEKGTGFYICAIPPEATNGIVSSSPALGRRIMLGISSSPGWPPHSNPSTDTASHPIFSAFKA